VAPNIGGSGNLPSGGGPIGLLIYFYDLPVGSPPPSHFNNKSYSCEQSYGF